MAAFVVASLLVISPKADASLLTLNDGTDVWTLDVQTGCTTCAVTLKVVFGAAPAHPGTFLDAVQWDLTNPNVNPTNVGAAGFFTGTTAGAAANWTFSANNLNANGCGGGSANAVCGDNSTNGAPVAANINWTWTFSAIFAAPLTSVTSGNIRASYNNANGQNAAIFSPGGGNFTTTTGGVTTSGETTTSGTIPEPATLSLLGLGLAGAAYRVRRRS